MTLLARRTFTVGVVAVLLALAAIGVARATSAPGPAPAVPAALAVAPAADAATADDAIGTDLDAILAADQTAAGPSAGPTTPRVAALRGQLRRLAAWRHLVHATVVVDLQQGGLTTVQLDHGTISAAGASSLTISETGGGSVTVALGSETRVRRNGAKAAVADLKAADEVFVMSKVEAGGTTAYLVVVPRT